ncbi:uncharacterized protein BDV14DRAFT_163773 [Aspergillus stella-maris]|uniref:uncharacterized protein n=1 Tax=Aspergillus stella-maris TaxID=1810926 RepID=UPI003CCCFC4D
MVRFRRLQGLGLSRLRYIMVFVSHARKPVGHQAARSNRNLFFCFCLPFSSSVPALIDSGDRSVVPFGPISITH